MGKRRSERKISLILLIGILFSIMACKGEEGKKNKQNQATVEENPNQPATNQNVFEDLSEEGIKKKIIGFLTKGEDRFLVDSCFRFYKGQMNTDDVEDWVVTVNELQYAKKQLTDIGNMGAIDYGYLGNYNHIFVIDGATGKWNGRPIGSSALVPLEIEIDYVNSNQYQVAKIFYRVNTSKFVAIFNSSVPSFQEIFKWELYNLSDPKNNGEPRAKILEFEGPENGKKNIKVFDAEVVAFDDQAFVDDLFSYEPKLRKTSKDPIHNFEYQLAERKYGEIKK